MASTCVYTRIISRQSSHERFSTPASTLLSLKSRLPNFRFDTISALILMLPPFPAISIYHYSTRTCFSSHSSSATVLRGHVRNSFTCNKPSPPMDGCTILHFAPLSPLASPYLMLYFICITSNGFLWIPAFPVVHLPSTPHPHRHYL